MTTRVGFIIKAHPRDEGAALIGGAAKSPFHLLRSLRHETAIVGVVVADHAGGFATQGYTVSGRPVRWLRLYPRTFVWNLMNLPVVLRLARRCEVLQCHHPHLGLGAALVRRTGVSTAALVVKAHGTAAPESETNPKRGWRRWVLALNRELHRRHDSWVLRSADRCVVSSDHQHAEMIERYGVDPDRIRTIYNGFDPALTRVRRSGDVVESSGPHLVFVGRVVPKKGFHQLHGLYAAVLEAHPTATMTMVLGSRDRIEDPDTYRYIESTLLPLAGCSAAHDLREEELHDVLARSDVGLVPSLGYESIPSVIYEMCGAGLPTFATYRWGIPEVLPPEFGLSGCLEDDAARVVAFIDGRLQTWDSEAWAARYREHGYDRLVRHYLELYAEARP